MKHINSLPDSDKPNLVIYVSDNESWLDSGHYGRFGGNATATMEEFNKLRRVRKDAKMICIDLAANAHTQAPSRENILNVGGFSDAVYDVIGNWTKGQGTFIDTIEKIDLDSIPDRV